MNTLTVFEHETLGQIRTTMVDGDPWFVAADVCQALGLTNPRDAISILDDDERNTVGISDGIRGNPNVNIISEAGLYTLIFRSRKKAAKEFKRWVTHEVLPSIRKTGVYAVNQPEPQDTMQILAALSHPDQIEAVLKQLAALQHRNFLLESEVERYRKDAELYPVHPPHEIHLDLRAAAYEIGCPRSILVDYCLSHRFLFRDEQGELVPYYNKQAIFVTERRDKELTILVTPEGRRVFKTLIRGGLNL